MGRMGPAILIAHGNPGDHLHDRAFALAGPRPKVAWIGAANGDSQTWFDRAAAVFRKKYGAEVELARTVGPVDADETRRVVAGAQMIYLAGGDVGLLAERARALGLDELIRRRHAEGVLVVGVSAGAIGLTRWWVRFPDDDSDDEPAASIAPARFACIGALELAIDCHDEESDWEELRALLEVWAHDEPEARVEAWGIPAGGALEVASDGRVTHLGPAPKRLRLDGGRIVE
jgi:Peptidase family S51